MNKIIYINIIRRFTKLLLVILMMNLGFMQYSFADGVSDCPVGFSKSTVFSYDVETLNRVPIYASFLDTNVWSISQSNPFAGNNHLHGNNLATVSDAAVEIRSLNGDYLVNGIVYMTFEHYYIFEEGKDGGVVEYTLNDGGTWIDAASLIIDNNYSGTISVNNGNPLEGREAFTGQTPSYITSTLDLSSLSGSNVRFRFRIGTDSSVGGYGWDIDNVKYHKCNEPSPAEITSPEASTLTSTSVEFTWDAKGRDIEQWWLLAGSSEGDSSYFVGGDTGASRSIIANGLPNDASTIYLRIWYQVVGGGWDKIDTTYTAFYAYLPEMVSPTPSTVLSGSSEVFSWAVNVADITGWTLVVGSYKVAGTAAGDYAYIEGDSSVASTLVTGLPTDGSTIYSTLWVHYNGNVTPINSSYTASSYTVPEITTPAPTSTLSGANQTFSWDANGTNINQWWLYAGRAVGAYEYAIAGGNGASNTAVITGLPTDGSTVYVRIWFEIDGDWVKVDTTYTAKNTVQITSPVPNSTLTNMNQQFNWVFNGVDVQNWWFYAGSSVGGFDYAMISGDASVTHAQVSGVPLDGEVVYVRIWYQVDGVWTKFDVAYNT